MRKGIKTRKEGRALMALAEGEESQKGWAGFLGAFL